MASTDPHSNAPQDGHPEPPETSEDQEERRKTARHQGLAYQAASEAVVAILIAAGVGYWADGKLDTSPWLLFLGTALGFTAFVMRLLRLGRQLEKLRASEAESDA